MKKVMWSSHILCSKVLHGTEGGDSACHSLRKSLGIGRTCEDLFIKMAKRSGEVQVDMQVSLFLVKVLVI